jgi:hypothetical protein
MLFVCGDLPVRSVTTGTELQRRRDYDFGSWAKIMITAELDEVASFTNDSE